MIIPDDFWDENFNSVNCDLLLCCTRSGSWFITDAPEDHIAKNKFIVWYGYCVD